MDDTYPSYVGGFSPAARFRQRNKPWEAHKYDFRAARSHLRNTNTVMESVVHLIMGSMVSGLIIMHSLYHEGGIWTGVVLNITLGALIGYYTCILVWSAQKLYGRVMMTQLSYPDIVEAAILLSPWPKFRKHARCFRYSLEGFLLLHLYGSCCVFVIMIGRNLKELVEGDEIFTDDGDPPLRVYILALLFPCIMICLLTNLKNLAPFALICNMYAVAIMILVIWYGLRTKTPSPLHRPAFQSFKGLFQAFAVNLFILDIFTYALPVENIMAEPKKFHHVVLFGMPIFVFSMILVGFIGNWHYGPIAISPITIHFPYEPFPVQLKVFLCLILYVIFSITFYRAFDIEWFYLRRNHLVINHWFWERFYRIFHVILIDLIAFGMPNVTRMMGCIGCLSSSFIMLIYPPFIELLLDWEYPGLGRYKWRLVKSACMIVLSFAVIIAACYFNIYSTVEETIQYMGRAPRYNVSMALSEPFAWQEHEMVMHKEVEITTNVPLRTNQT